VKSLMDKVVSDLMNQESRWIEAEMLKLVGTGLDLAVLRSDFSVVEDGDRSVITRKISCMPILPDYRPPLQPGQTCIVYEVSKYKGSAT
jgi:hypothetical protein